MSGPGQKYARMKSHPVTAVLIVIVCSQLSGGLKHRQSSNRYHNALSYRDRSLSRIEELSNFGLLSDFVPVDYASWDPFNITGPYYNQTFKVAIHHQPPLVVIDDWAAELGWRDLSILTEI